MTVPVTFPYNMFGATDGSNPTSIQGAIDQGNNGSVDGDTRFAQLIAASTFSYFHPSYKDGATSISGINDSRQYRGYPHIVIQNSLRYSTSSSAVCSNSTGIYYTDKAANRFTAANVIWSNSTGTTFATAGWYSNGTYRRYWTGTQFTTTALCSSGNPVRYRYYITGGGSGYTTSQFSGTWCGASGVLLATQVYNASNSNVAGTTDNIFYTTSTGSTTYGGGGLGRYYCISTISSQNTNSIVSKQYTVISSNGSGLDAGIWACNGGIFPY